MRRTLEEVYQSEDPEDVEEEEKELEALEEAFFKALCRWSQAQNIKEFFKTKGQIQQNNH